MNAEVPPFRQDDQFERTKFATLRTQLENAEREVGDTKALVERMERLARTSLRSPELLRQLQEALQHYDALTAEVTYDLNTTYRDVATALQDKSTPPLVLRNFAEIVERLQNTREDCAERAEEVRRKILQSDA